MLNDLIDNLDDLFSVCLSDSISDSLERNLSLRCRVDEVRETNIVELFLEVGANMKVSEHIWEEGKGLGVKGGDVEGASPLDVDVVDDWAEDWSQESVIATRYHAYIVVRDGYILD